MSKSILNPIRCDQCGGNVNKTHPKISWMYISHELKAIWLENPKCASTSIKIALGIQPKGVVPGDLSNPYGFKRLLLPRDRILEFTDYFTFGFCRNPWDRMVSTWKNFTIGLDRQRLLIKHWGIQDPAKLSFQHFVRLIDKHQPKVNHHWVQQNMFLPLDKINIDFIGRMESLSKGWNVVAERLGIKRNIGHVYRTKHDHYSRYYDDETRKIVDRLYSEDISLFGYTFSRDKIDE